MGTTFFSCEPFKDFHIVNKSFDGFPVKEKALLQFLINEPDAFSELDKNTRAKYRKKIKSYSYENKFPFEHPETAVAKKFESFITDLKMMMGVDDETLQNL